MRRIFGKAEGARRLTLQLVEVGAGGHTPYHAQVWEHEVFVLEGSGVIRGPKGDQDVRPGDAVFIPAGEPHQILADAEPLRFLCAMPILGEEAALAAPRVQKAAGGETRRREGEP